MKITCKHAQKLDSEKDGKTLLKWQDKTGNISKKKPGRSAERIYGLGDQKEAVCLKLCYRFLVARRSKQVIHLTNRHQKDISSKHNLINVSLCSLQNALASSTPTTQLIFGSGHLTTSPTVTPRRSVIITRQ